MSKHSVTFSSSVENDGVHGNLKHAAVGGGGDLRLPSEGASSPVIGTLNLVSRRRRGADRVPAASGGWLWWGGSGSGSGSSSSEHAAADDNYDFVTPSNNMERTPATTRSDAWFTPRACFHRDGTTVPNSGATARNSNDQLQQSIPGVSTGDESVQLRESARKRCSPPPTSVLSEGASSDGESSAEGRPNSGNGTTVVTLHLFNRNVTVDLRQLTPPTAHESSFEESEAEKYKRVYFAELQQNDASSEALNSAGEDGSCRVRFCPQTTVFEYPKISDNEHLLNQKEEEELVEMYKAKCVAEGIDPSGDGRFYEDDTDDGIVADPTLAFIPLIGLNRLLVRGGSAEFEKLQWLQHKHSRGSDASRQSSASSADAASCSSNSEDPGLMEVSRESSDAGPSNRGSEDFSTRHWATSATLTFGFPEQRADSALEEFPGTSTTTPKALSAIANAEGAKSSSSDLSTVSVQRPTGVDWSLLQDGGAEAFESEPTTPSGRNRTRASLSSTAVWARRRDDLEDATLRAAELSASGGSAPVGSRGRTFVGMAHGNGRVGQTSTAAVHTRWRLEFPDIAGPGSSPSSRCDSRDMKNVVRAEVSWPATPSNEVHV